MDCVDQLEVGKFDLFWNIDWIYEFLVLKYYDFIYEEIDVDVLVVEGWFELVILYENFCMCFFFFN